MLHEKCAVFGLYVPGHEAARLAYFGLFALQHRGQEGSGITVSDGETLRTHKKPGLVAQVYSEAAIAKLTGYMAIGHNRYSTSNGVDDEHLQPVVGQDKTVALAHNGNLPSTKALVDFLTAHGISTRNHSDSELMAKAISYYVVQGKPLEKAVEKAFPLFTGAFSLLVMTADTLIGVRDRCGIRPLCLGKLNGGYVLSSETCALDTVGSDFIREVNPGEMVVINEKGLRSRTLAPADSKLDIFEFVYFSRPDSVLLGKSVEEVRRAFGTELAKETRIEADIVVPIPDSAISAAIGYAEESGIPYSPVLIKNRYIGRTFIQPEQLMRDQAVQMKLNPIRSAIAGKRVVLVDDSIVRGTTSPAVVALLRKAGAKEVHFLVSSPPYMYPDFYGIDTPCQQKLLAHQQTPEQICAFLGADSLHYLSYDGMIRATGVSEDNFCTSCFTGEYPIDIREREAEVIRPEPTLSAECPNPTVPNVVMLPA